MSLKTRERIRPLRVFFSGPVDLFFMSLTTRERVRPLQVFFSGPGDLFDLSPSSNYAIMRGEMYQGAQHEGKYDHQKDDEI